MPANDAGRVVQVATNLTVTDRALAVFRLEMARRVPRVGEVMALHFMPSFTNADGTTVHGFSPGYAIDYVPDREFGNGWVLAHLPDRTSFRFMPRFDWQDDEAYVLDRASGYTFSVARLKR